jgi:hypothetical protein
MANTPISGLTAAVSVAGTDVFPSVQTAGVGPVKTSLTQIKTFVLGPADTLPVANGGTGLTSLTAGYIPFGAGTSAFGSSASLFWDSVNSQLAIAAGTDLLPSLSTVSDSNTGLYFPAADAIGFTTAGVERMRIISSGNVGIGTSSPRAPLAFPATVSTAGVPNKIRLFDDGASNLYGFSVSSGLLDIVAGTGGGIALYTNNANERMRIDSNGNIICNTAAIATNATNGFLYVPGCAGTPTGTPTSITGRSPIVVDTTNNKLYFYSGGQWRDAGP